MLRTITAVLASIGLCACGGSSSEGGPGPNIGDPSTQGVDYSKIQQSEVEATVLKQASDTELLTRLKNGVRFNVRFAPEISTSVQALDARTTANPSPAVEPASAFNDALAGESAGDGNNFSQTNTHVQGVDEADFVKYDGKYMYVSTFPHYAREEERPRAEIRILETDPESAGVNELSRIDVNDDTWGGVGEIYLANDDDGNTETMVTLRSTWSNVVSIEPIFGALALDALSILPENKIEISGYNVTDPSNPDKSFTMEIDGFIQNSRKIDNTLYLVTEYYPYLPNIFFFLDNETAIRNNEDSIQALTIADLMPSVSINGETPQPLHVSGDCFIPVDTDSNTGLKNIVSIIAIDLESQQISAAKCLNSQVSGIYASGESLYIGASAYKNWTDYESFTVVHKFTLGDSIDYRSTGVVPGFLGWRDPSFRMDEYNDTFRIVTTSRDDNWEPIHRLHVLQDNASTDEMNIVGKLPNDERPEPIGKPFEEIFGVRFMEDRAFIVTFERIDPLYVIDLADAEDPQIAGELEVPGFSTYLHPVDDNYLLGIGRNANEAGIATGLKTSLYDVSDISAPLEIDSIIIDGRSTHSPATSDLRAISFLRNSQDQLRFAFPVSKYSDNAFAWEYEGLHLYEINGLAGNSAILNDVGVITSERQSAEKPWPDYSGFDRSVLHDEAVYYIHASDVWSAFWSSPQASSGPH